MSDPVSRICSWNSDQFISNRKDSAHEDIGVRTLDFLRMIELAVRMATTTTTYRYDTP